MALKNIVQRYVRKAFNSISDLADDATFVNKTSSFNFNTGAATVVSAAGVTAKCFLLGNKGKELESTNAEELSLLFNAEDLPSVDNYDTITLRGQDYSPVLPFKNDGYTVTVRVVRRK